jgi:hypothetical protein
MTRADADNTWVHRSPSAAETLLQRLAAPEPAASDIRRRLDVIHDPDTELLRGMS